MHVRRGNPVLFVHLPKFFMGKEDRTKIGDIPDTGGRFPDHLVRGHPVEDPGAILQEQK